MAAPPKTPFGFSPAAPVAPIAPAGSATSSTAAAPTGLLDQAKAAFAKVQRFREDLNLPNPGTYEGVNREVKRKE